MDIQWFPGHMAKTRRMISENVKLTDAVIELTDARIPMSSRNPDVDKLIGGKPKLVVLNKSDMADPKVSELWKNFYSRSGQSCIFVDSIKGTGMNKIKTELKEIMRPVFEKDLNKGRIFRPIRVLVLGIPNVGKSSFINKISGKAVAETGDRPGVTRSKQWIRVEGEIELLDTPGILWPKFDDEEAALNLAFTGAIKDEIMDIPELCLKLIEKLSKTYPEEFKNRYKLKDINIEDCTPLEIMEKCALNRGCLIKGGEIDYNRISAIILDEFRGCKIGNISLEIPKRKVAE